MPAETQDSPAMNEREQRLAMSINDLNLTAKAHAALRNARITTVGGILEAEQGKGLLRVRNLGKAQYLDIQSVMQELGVPLDGSILPAAKTHTEPAFEGQPQARDEVIVQSKPQAPPEPPAPVPTPVPADRTLPEHQAAPTTERAPPISPSPVRPLEPETQPQLRTAVFVDYEHWFAALRNLHGRRPNIRTWFDDLKTRGRLLEVTFFGNFSDTGGMKNEITNIRMYTNRIIETKNPSEHSKKDFTDFIMLDNIYQKVIASPEVEQVVLFTGDGHFSSVAAYLRNFLSKTVGVYGVDKSISSQLEAISDWCVRIPFVDEPYMECREAILKNLKYAEAHTKSPTFQATVRLVAERYNLPDDAVEAELRLMINEGVVYTVSERSRWDYTVMLNILKVNWNLAGQSVP